MRFLAAACVLLPSVALAAVSPLDSAGYRAIDSLAPDPALPAAGIGLLVGSTDSGSFDNPADDQSFHLSLSSWGNTGVYGYSRSRIYVSTNGTIAGSSSNASFNNTPFPEHTFGGSQVFAPFWDDLVPVAGLSTLTWEVESGEYVIVKWEDFARFDAPAARLSFRATIGLNDGWVLFQYTKLEGAGADGSSASVGIQDRDADEWILYSADAPGALPTGTAAAGSVLLEILFDVDSDIDRLPGYLEESLGTDDGLWDSDGGGVSDLVEYIHGTDPTNPADDDPTDTDGDGLSDVDEAWFGTDVALADTDGDTLSDWHEVTGSGTDPLLPDTDGDTYPDNVELDAGTDPLSPYDFPLVEFQVDGSDRRKVRAETCSDGNVHVIAFDDEEDDAIYYYVLSPDGVPVIAETRFDIGMSNVRHTGIACVGDTTYLTYDLVASLNLGDDDAERGGSEDEGLIGVIAVTIILFSSPAGTRPPSRSGTP